MIVALDIAQRVVDALQGKNCWYVSCGGSAGTSFELALGAKLPRRHVFKNRENPTEFDKYEGESNLLVWCTWRLDGPNGPVASSDNLSNKMLKVLRSLAGARVKNVNIEKPGWDIRLEFSNRLTLRVFCDHLPGDPTFDGNWDLFTQDRVISIGVGSKCEVESRPL
ncbi:MAG: hypothetical protein L0Y72_02350 [Gemmataceae bacterium]|nr:hypothetical protein [Gemmataceae bacterium]MCI0737857.1 hypothetical protein [Gemmataceae bacterium]